MKTLESIRLGADGPVISRLGMGCWATGGHGWGKVDDEESIQAIQSAYEHGVTFFDTADVYGLGKSETILSRALGKRRKEVVIASKGGVRWNEHGEITRDCSPQYLRKAVEGSLRRLQLECIPLYYVHCPDGCTPVAEVVGALDRLREEGKIGAIGVSNFSGEQLKEALATISLQAVQVQYNLLHRAKAEELIPLCRTHGLVLVAWGALADGLLTGKFNRETTFGSDDHRSRSPDFQGEAFQKNLNCVEALRSVAEQRQILLSQLALRWVLDSFEASCSLFGAKSTSQVIENIDTDGWSLSVEERVLVDRIVESRDL